MKLRYPSDNKGFTLIELLIAMLILSVGLLAVAGLQVTAIQGNASAKWVTAATTLAEEKMEELKSSGFSGLSNTAWTAPVTVYLAGAGNFSRRFQITEPAIGNLKLIDVRVTWPTILGNKQVDLSSYVAK
ncbi:MAG: type IV pilus modification protein PilV [Dethiobacteria bacterium]|nr:type IV pilus modification protein PilV [Dethiobacteria bacterium]